MRTKTFIGMMVMLLALGVVTVYGNEKDVYPTESLFGEWWLVGWNDKGTWFDVDTNYVNHQHLSIEIKENDYMMAYSMANEIFVGLLTFNGSEMVFGGEMRGFSTTVYCDIMENNFFEDHIRNIKSYQLKGNLLRLYYTDEDYFVFTNYISGINNLPKASTKASCTYDLTGRPLMSPPTKGIYIRNGKKYWVK